MLFGCAAAVAQSEGDLTPDGFLPGPASDTSRLYVRLPEVVVSATRTRIPVDESPSAVTVITREELSRSGSARLSGVLQAQPGLSVRDLGGLNSIKTLSVRGTGAVHTLFLLNGLRLNSPQNGLVDLGLLTGEAFEQIEIVRGGQSALYGADAVGGLVHLVPREARDSMQVGISVEAGSYGLWAGRANSAFRLGTVSVAAGFGYEQSEGDFAFRNNVQGQEQMIRRSGADSKFGTGFLHILAPFSSATSLSVFTTATRADRGSPGPFTGAAPRSARLDDRQVQTSAQLMNSLGRLGMLSTSVGYAVSWQRYTDVTLAPGTSDLTKTSSVELSAEWDIPLSASALAVVVADAGTDRVESVRIPSAPDRRRAGINAGMELHTSVLDGVIPRLIIFPSVRSDWISDGGGRVSPRLGANLWLLESGALKLRLAAGTSYRVPNFNELYWIDGGNPALRPERAFSVDAGIVLAFDAFGMQTLDVGIFRMSMQDRITGWPPVNLASSVLSGLECSWRWDLVPRGVYGRLHVTHTRAMNADEPYRGNQLPLVPLWEGRAAFGGRLGAVRGELALVSMSRRYTTMDNATSLSVEAFAVLNAWVEVGFALMGSRLGARFECENVLNTSYEIMPAYPMPLRSFRAGIHYDL